MKLNQAVFGVLLSAAFSFYATAANATADIRLPQTVTLAPMNDPWPAARERFWDIDNNPFNDWITNDAPNGKYSYANAKVSLTFDRAPGVPYFVGHLRASGLKPNFAYQLKLVGKPQRGTRGWGTHGDDLSNERIGYVARWWDDTLNPGQTNFDDTHYLDHYKNAEPGTEHDIYGFQFMGDVVTDRFGNVNEEISGQFSYHITWASWQSGIRDVTFGTFPVQGGAQAGGFYGYGAAAPDSNVTLYYEEQWDRPNPVALPSGAYKCRFVLTEETFHNFSTLGGYWKGVLASEDYDAQGNHDVNPKNDIDFTIGADAPSIGTMSPQAALDAVNTPREFTVPYSDGDGDLHYVYFQVGTAKTGLQCLYNVAAKKLYLRDTADSAWLGGYAPGAARTISNARGQLNCASTRVETVAGGIRVRWNLSAAPGWAAAPQRVYGYARDRIGLTVGWKTLGSWTLNEPPQNIGFAPATARGKVGTKQVFTSEHSDGNGAANIRYVLLHVGDAQSAAASLRCYYNAVQNKLYLLNDAGTTYLGGFAPGSAHIIANAQGQLDCEATSVSLSGKSLTVNWFVTPAAPLGNTQRDLWCFALDLPGAKTGWNKMGRWQIVG